MEVFRSIWLFIQNQILGMKWLNEVIGKTLNAFGIEITSRWGGSIQFFIYDVIKIMVLLTCLIFVRIFVLPVRCNQSLKRIGRDLPDLYFSIPVFIIRIFLSVHF